MYGTGWFTCSSRTLSLNNKKKTQNTLKRKKKQQGGYHIVNWQINEYSTRGGELYFTKEREQCRNMCPTAEFDLFFKLWIQTRYYSLLRDSIGSAVLTFDYGYTRIQFLRGKKAKRKRKNGVPLFAMNSRSPLSLCLPWISGCQWSSVFHEYLVASVTLFAMNI